MAYPLRISPKLLDAVKRVAAAEMRSANAQIEVLVKEALLKRGAIRREETPPDTDETNKGG